MIILTHKKLLPVKQLKIPKSTVKILILTLSAYTYIPVVNCEVFNFSVNEWFLTNYCVRPICKTGFNLAMKSRRLPSKLATIVNPQKFKPRKMLLLLTVQSCVASVNPVYPLSAVLLIVFIFSVNNSMHYVNIIIETFKAKDPHKTTPHTYKTACREKK